MAMFQKRSAFPEPIIPPTFQGVGMTNLGGSPEDRALRLSAVWACVRLLCDSVSMMPVNAYTMRQGMRVQVADPPILRAPSAYGTFSDWVYQAMASLVLTGNVFGLVTSRDAQNYPTQIELLPPNRMTMRNTDHGWVYWMNGAEVELDKVWHVAAYLMPGSPLGMSPIQYAALTLGTLGGAEAFGREWFANGAHPSAILTAPGNINKTQADTIKQRMKDAVKTNDFAVLGSGLQWTQIQISPEEAQFLETQKFGINQIARIFGVPPEMIGGDAGNAMTYANVTQRAMDFLTYSVQPWITRLEAKFAPLLPGQQHLRFDTSVLVRLDPETRWVVNQARINTAAATVDELRSEDGLGSVPWGDKPYMPGIKTAAAGAAIRFGMDPKTGDVPEPKPAPVPAPIADKAPADDAPAPTDSKDDSKDA